MSAAMTRSTCLLLAITLYPALVFAQESPAPESRLWYRQPAENWLQALPVGNGRLGAMVYDGVDEERLQLDEDTVWSGNRSDYDRVGAYRHLPEIRRLLFTGEHAQAQALVTRELLGDRPLGAYQPLGDLVLKFPSAGEVTQYHRELDLDRGVASVRFQQGGAVFTREVFASAPAQVLVVRLGCNQPGRISFRASLGRKEGAVSAASGENGLILRGQADQGQPTAGVQFVAALRALADGGQVQAADGTLQVDSANAVTLLVAAATDFRRQEAWGSAPGAQLDRAAGRAYEALLAEHLADHRRLFRRVELKLGDAQPSPLPTDQRIERVRAGESDLGLVELYFQFGRYLLISSSRPGTMPANLQGLWNEELSPPWFCGYHFNINVQMNYWLAEVGNLSECHEPLLELIERLREPGRKTARDVYHCRGFVVSHRTNGNFFTSPAKGLNVWPVGAAWLCQHVWEHYRFTADREYLAGRAYPVLREAAEFFLDWLVEDPKTGRLVSGPSMSPENMFIAPDGSAQGLCMGPAMDQQIIAELWDNCLEAAGVLQIDDAFVRQLRAARPRLAGPKIGSDGRLLEWQEEFREREPGHRHVSHLYAVHPGWQITPRTTPALAEAARKSLAHRLSRGQVADQVQLSNSNNVGWSLAWTVNLWSRLGEAKLAHDALLALLQRCTSPNLFDTHPRSKTAGVFQIDGNLGGAAGIAEMLLQSHAGQIELLPALPTEWADGHVRGLRARGDYEVDLVWRSGQLEQATLRSPRGGPCTVRLGQRVATFSLQPGETLALDRHLATDAGTTRRDTTSTPP